MMELISNGISGVRAFELPVGVWADGRTVCGPRVCLVKWRSALLDKVHQVYVNGKYAGTTVDNEQRQLVVQTPSCFERGARVEVFAVEPSDGDIDFSDELELSKGDGGRIKLSLLRSQRLAAGARYEVYYDGGSGNIDYEQSIGTGQIWAYEEDKAGLGLAGFGVGDWGYEWAGGAGFGRGNFGSGEFGVDADVIEWVSPALEAGVYKFGVKVIYERGNQSAASETGEITLIPAARPANELNVLIFDKETNEMVLGIGNGQ